MSGHKKNDSTCDSTALLRGQSHSRESSGASNLSVKYTTSSGVASANVSAMTTPVRTKEVSVPSVAILSTSSPRRRRKRARKRAESNGETNSDGDPAQDDVQLDETDSCDNLDTPPNTEGMLQNGDSKSQNSDYGSFCNTPSDTNCMPPHPSKVPAESAKGFSTTSDKPPTATAEEVTRNIDQSVMATEYQRQPLLDNSPWDSSCSEDDAGANSSGYTRRKTRRGGAGGNTLVRIDVDLDAVDASPLEDVHIAGEPVKTLLAFLFLFFAWVATTTSLALTHDRVPDIKPLPDVFLNNTTYQSWGLNASEIIIMISTMSAFVVTLFHKHRSVVLRRIFLLVALHYYYRSITMFITVLPVANTNYKCENKLNSTEITPIRIAQRVLKLLSGFGLSINGNHVYCGDYIYSGHTMTLIMGYLVIKAYSPKRWFLLHYASFCLSFAGILFLLLGRGHYSIDVIIAYWITTRLWWLYHTMCDNGSVLKDNRNQHNFFRNMWWWYIFYYFECNVPIAVPREFNLPIPNKILRMKPFSYLFCSAKEEPDSPPPEPYIVSSAVTNGRDDVEAAN